jgi:hypothetical protein
MDTAATTSEQLTVPATTTLTPVTATTAVVTTTTVAPPTATLTATGDVTTSVDGGKATAVTGEVPLAAGTSIVTAAGEALLTYDDGSLLRLDGNTTVAFGDGSRGSLTAGRVWARAKPQKAAESYRIETPNGVVTATATAFVVNCPTSKPCVVTVVEGSVDVTANALAKSAAAPAALVIGEEKSTPVNWDNVFGDPWVLAAANSDTSIGWPGPVDLAKKLGPTFASVGGTFTGTRTVTSCAPDDSLLCIDTPVGDVADRNYQLSVDCSQGFPCIGKALTQYKDGRTKQTVESLTDLVFDGTSYRWALTVNGNPLCSLDEDSDGSIDQFFGDGTYTLSWTLTPSAADVAADGLFTVTTASGVVTSAWSVSVQPNLVDSRCTPYVGGNQEASITVTKTA